MEIGNFLYSYAGIYICAKDGTQMKIECKNCKQTKKGFCKHGKWRWENGSSVLPVKCLKCGWVQDIKIPKKSKGEASNG